ncbi:ADP-ribose 1''-phosphate phosphatase CYBJADRAFT_165932 [Cyberlindnera jadinii NRRL Y-1542]|uniref:ADP-ribose 1''-phosphate phosphatase n=1 Tax=Cyberlindnera jadinii (strain ATCC 18201 / CBS 1600 / BCRC 20928 / JCM 3617 / NBRC 0987 / NRRL Y-1542) TaxID=983966 RepID=A0A1E4S6M9_CYBJN|nr:hypothetical protein CYBJADRAFT_165932 [Cyberlindnera jadinii NRRL Y-1542]ODV75174.1 hypothetical protein CYBJADRAFT_165932 [Cyberlindnera jadinii NRRL Y-1542]
MSIKYIQGNVLKCAKPSIIAHACNTQGIWGGGIAYQIAQLFPQAEEEYIAHCEKHGNSLLGTTLLILTNREEKGNELLNGQAHVIACLFTSVGGGGSADPVESILAKTKLAIEDMKKQLVEMGADCEVSMPKINAGIFRVPWERTEAILKESGLNYDVYTI